MNYPDDVKPNDKRAPWNAPDIFEEPEEDEEIEEETETEEEDNE